MKGLYFDTSIKWENKVKYLRATIMDKNLIFSSQVKNVVSKGKCVKFSLFPLINEQSPLYRSILNYSFLKLTSDQLQSLTQNLHINISKSCCSWSKLEALRNLLYSRSNHRIRLQVLVKRHHQLAIIKNPDTKRFHRTSRVTNTVFNFP